MGEQGLGYYCELSSRHRTRPQAVPSELNQADSQKAIVKTVANAEPAAAEAIQVKNVYAAEAIQACQSCGGNGCGLCRVADPARLQRDIAIAERPVESDAKAGNSADGAANGIAFYFIHAHKLRDASSHEVGKLQDLRRKEDWVVKQTINLHDAYNGKHKNEYCTVSHRWETKDEPDVGGVQLEAIQAHLAANPEIKYVWYDYYCMPQGPDRSPEDKAEFHRMLKEVNVLYLGTQVLILMDLSYMSRFWTSFEAYLSMQDTTSTGLRPTTASKCRAQIRCLHNAPAVFATTLKDMWQGKSPTEAAEILVKPDVLVTNQGDKDVQIEKLKALNPRIREVFQYAEQEAARKRAELEAARKRGEEEGALKRNAALEEASKAMTQLQEAIGRAEAAGVPRAQMQERLEQPLAHCRRRVAAGSKTCEIQ
eukprot:CAMPEP_0178464386 /NCGR_PEP_ID=MMETSP0689_2-20121128/50816_1 /TAXON_ID=160604 /ORGANISM="Amphidinium massartii, Strain CS-259" /LENGTH=423 /DNA_ID=CAMNT_0020091287 /DNA_START=219 /DNA_END=1491 /DNA_ORIENTATION=+